MIPYFEVTKGVYHPRGGLASLAAALARIFTELGAFKSAAIGKVLPPTKELEPDSRLVMWDIVLDHG